MAGPLLDATDHYNLGLARANQRKLDEAIGEFRAASRIKPDFADAHCGLGFALQAQGKLDEAITEYRTAIRLKPDSALAHCNLLEAIMTRRSLTPRGPLSWVPTRKTDTAR